MNLPPLNFPDWPEMQAGFKLPTNEFAAKVVADLTALGACKDDYGAECIAKSIITIAREHLRSRGFTDSEVEVLLQLN